MPMGQRSTSPTTRGLTAFALNSASPDTLPPFFPRLSAVFANQPRDRAHYERRFVGIQAHNRWMVDFCAAVPGRRKSPVRALSVRHRSTPSPKFDGAMTLGCLLYSYQRWRLITRWKACGRDDTIPSGNCARSHDAGQPARGAGTPDVGTESAEGAVLFYEVHFFARRSLWHMIFGGVFERFPDRKFVMTEEGLSWTSAELGRLDHYYANVIQVSHA